MVVHDPNEQWPIVHTMHDMTVHGMAGSNTKGFTEEGNTWLLWTCTSSQQVGV